jgi:hypothetical protein
MFAMFPVLALYAQNVAEVAPSDIGLPIGILAGLAFVLLLVWVLILRNLNRAGLVTSLFIVLFTSYGHVADTVDGWGVTDAVMLPIWSIVIVVGTYWAIRTRWDLRRLTAMLNLVALTLIVVPSITIVIHEARADWDQTGGGQLLDAQATETAAGDASPDIYYIILDRYASASTLESTYGFDNSEFLEYLSCNGFYVASESVSNYPTSWHSLASSLNMQYINYLGEELAEGFTDLDPIYAMLEDYEIWRFLKDRGYTFVHLGSWCEPTRDNRYADINIMYWNTPEFLVSTFETTMLQPVLEDGRLGRWLKGLPSWLVSPFWDSYRVDKWEGILEQFDGLAEMPATEDPTFVFAHVLVPHEPYVFDRDGNYVTVEQERERGKYVGYVEQLVFTNGKLVQLVDDILSASESPPVIILQADEGPRPERYETDPYHFSWEQATDAELREKMGILNALCLPNVDYEGTLYPSITPVNSLRLVLDLYFGTSLGLVPDRAYVPVDGAHPYEFLDVTDRLDPD